MGYNLKVTACRRMLPFMKKMLVTRKTIEWASENPAALSYKIREAIAASANHERYKPYAELKYLYRIRQRPGVVIAEWQGDTAEVEVAIELGLVEDVEAEVLESLQPTMNVTNASSLKEVVGATVAYSDSREIYFPNARLDLADMTRLYQFSSEKAWSIINHFDAGLTLSRRKIDPAIVWSPEREGIL